MLKYFLPDWEDRLDPYFNFDKDEYSAEHNRAPYQTDVYAHQMFSKLPYDGILLSLSIFQSKLALKNGINYKYTIRGHTNIKDYLKIPSNSKIEVMGDCGAFGYVKEIEPPEPFYNVKNIAFLYESLGFDYGVSVDHLVVDYVMVRNNVTGKKIKKEFTKLEKDNRIKITLENARKFLELHKKNNYHYIPIGVAQGYDLNTYKKSVKSLIKMGYSYIGIGGLVQYNSDFILDVLKEINPYISNVKLHLFGVLRPNYLKEFENLGVTSFDSASYLRKAWLRSGQNYLAPNGKWYAAIRVPQSSNVNLIKNGNINGYSKRDILKMEKAALTALINYDKGTSTIEEVLDVVIKYDNLLLRTSENLNEIKKRYIRTLEDKPWKSCKCDICKKIGIHVIIFRGCNRNKRRGFHNTWNFREIAKTNGIFKD